MLNLSRIGAQLENVAIGSGRLISWLLLPLVALTFAVVILRYGFNIGSIALQEGITYLHAFIIMLCMGYTLHAKEHVRVDIFYRGLSERRKALVDLVGGVTLLLPTCVTILTTSWSYAVNAWLLLEGSPEAGGLPLVFILKTLIPLLAILLLIQGAADIIRDFNRVTNGR